MQHLASLLYVDRSNALSSFFRLLDSTVTLSAATGSSPASNTLRFKVLRVFTLLFPLVLIGAVDAGDYVAKDTDLEAKHKFDLKQSLAQAQAHRLMDGMHFILTESIRPPPDEMQRIIEAAGDCETFLLSSHL